MGGWGTKAISEAKTNQALHLVTGVEMALRYLETGVANSPAFSKFRSRKFPLQTTDYRRKTSKALESDLIVCLPLINDDCLSK